MKHPDESLSTDKPLDDEKENSASLSGFKWEYPSGKGLIS
jgi:hypothetical protein